MLVFGNFWQGAAIGGIVAGLNHVMHKMDPPTGFKGKFWKDGTGAIIKIQMDLIL